MNICIFGDSITWGAFLPFREAWANLLRNYLESKDKSIALYDLGIDGNTSEDLLKRFDLEAAARNPEIIIFAIGTNDSAYKKTPSNHLVEIEKFKKNIRELVTHANKITKNIIFVGLAKGEDKKTNPLPRSTTGKRYTKKEVYRYNDAIKKVAIETNAKFVSIINVLKDEDFDDGLHPNLGGHKKIFVEVRRTLRKSDYIK